MALTLLDRTNGPVVVQTVQLAIECEAQLPFNAGSLSKAPTEIVELAVAGLIRHRGRRAGSWTTSAIPGDRAQ